MEGKIVAIIEGALFVAGDNGATVADLRRVLEVDAVNVRNALKELAKKHERDANSGLAVVEFGGRFKLVTKPEHKHYHAALLDYKLKNPLTHSAMEVLAVIAYNQPCTRKKVEEIRGTASVTIVESLVEKGLISGETRESSPGNPILYETTPRMLDLLGLKSLDDLPRLSINEALEIGSNLFDGGRFDDGQPN